MSERWDKKWMDVAEHIQTWSKDRSTKVGCVIVDSGRQTQVSAGYNGFCRGIDDDIEERHERPAKYKWTEHAERNAVYDAAARGSATLGCTIYVPWYPCVDCARAIIQAGITVMVARMPDFEDPRWGADFVIAKEMLAEAGVHTRWYKE